MKTIRPLLQYSALTLLICVHTASFASGFALEEANAVQTGEFNAGGSAIAEDASTAWFNPAGLIRIDKPQVVVAANEIWLNTKFNGTIDQNIQGFPGYPAAGTGPVSVNNVSGSTANLIPTFHLAYPINPALTAGFSVTTPFGLATDYNADTYVRYAVTETKLRTIDLSPSIGIKINPAFSIGIGFDEERLLANFDTYVGLPAISTSYDTSSQNAMSDWSTGWHSGILYQPTPTTRFGLSYHSKVTHDITGYSLLTGPLAPNGVSEILNDTNSSIVLPAHTTFSAYHDMNNRWAVMGSIVYTQWAVLQNIVINNAAGSSGPLVITIPENLKNTWRIGVGTHYKINDKWLVRTGAGIDGNPTNNSNRNLIFPDGRRYALAVGGRFQATKNLAVDGGFTHEWIKSKGINNTMMTGAQTTDVMGKSNTYANVLGLQITYSFA